MKHTISLTLNGEPWQTEVEPNDTLLHLLRNKLGVKSPIIEVDRWITIKVPGRTQKII